MKKRIIYAIAAALAISFASSCSQQNDFVQPIDELVEVSFNLSIEGKTSTRAISDGTGANQLTYAVFNDLGEIVVEKNVEDAPKDLLSGHSVTFTLAKGHTYRAVFWAQNKECAAYSISDEMDLTVDYAGVNNDEKRDAFYAYADIAVDGQTVETIVLKRPFAQVNVGSYKYDVDLAKELGVVITKSVAKIKDVPNTLSLYDGTFTGGKDVVVPSSEDVEDYPCEDVTYVEGAIPTEKLVVDVDENGVKEEYEYLSMWYILADEASSIHEMEFELIADNGDVYTINSGLGSVPVQRNWRTNIIGQFLTGTVGFKIKVDHKYDADDVVNNGVYYNFNENVTIENRAFVFNNLGNSATFASENGEILTMNNVSFAGKIAHIDFGEYRSGGNYVDFNNILTNVSVENLTFSSAINKHIPPTGSTAKFGTAVWLRGHSELKDCTFKGSVCATPGVYTCDAAVVNLSDATITDSEIERLYVYEHSKVTLNGTTKIKTLTSGALESAQGGKLIIGSGVEVDVIEVVKHSTYPANIEIQAGAKVGTINFHGAVQTKFVNNGTVTTINP